MNPKEEGMGKKIKKVTMQPRSVVAQGLSRKTLVARAVHQCRRKTNSAKLMRNADQLSEFVWGVLRPTETDPLAFFAPPHASLGLLSTLQAPKSDQGHYVEECATRTSMGPVDELTSSVPVFTSS